MVFAACAPPGGGRQEVPPRWGQPPLRGTPLLALQPAHLPRPRQPAREGASKHCDAPKLSIPTWSPTHPALPRLLRHFSLLAVPPPSNDATKAILSAMVSGWLADFGADLQSLAGSLVNASVEAYNRCAACADRSLIGARMQLARHTQNPPPLFAAPSTAVCALTLCVPRHAAQGV